MVGVGRGAPEASGAIAFPSFSRLVAGRSVRSRRADEPAAVEIKMIKAAFDAADHASRGVRRDRADRPAGERRRRS